MFGYVIANKEQLTAEQEQIYRAYYCGLCHSLKRQFGTFGRLTLNYDMTFMVLLLSDLYDPKTHQKWLRCMVHPRRKKKIAGNELIDYGAAMNVLLAYYNFLDDWEDERRRTARTAAMRLHRFIPEIQKRYPRQTRAVLEGMEALRAEEAKGPRDLDTAANIFGALLGQLFMYRKDYWAEDCRKFGEALGHFIYWMDAYEDLEKDRKRAGYNPLTLIEVLPDFEVRVEEMLKNSLGECALILERLPLAEHLDILRNILYSGIWSKYELLKKEKKNDSKSI